MQSKLRRRHILAGLAATGVVAPMAARAQPVLDATALGVLPNSETDQTAALQQALDQAAKAGQVLRLPAGVIHAAGLTFPGNLTVEGVTGATVLAQWQAGVVGTIAGRSAIVLRDIGFRAEAGAEALLTITSSEAVTLERCDFDSAAIGLDIADSAVTIRDCRFNDMGDAAIHSMNSRGLLISGNRIEGCGNAGIRIWRSQSGPDGSIVTANRIAKIDWRGGGNGQNGNGINVYRADEVIVADNHLADCAFSAIRLNSTNDSQVSGNTCLRSGEVAVFSEFAFSGSIIAGNIVDGAAQGISITNLDNGGQLAVCSGNIVRNIAPISLVNPDTNPVGIAAEAETAITGNTVQGVPGIAIAAGFGPYLRNVLISANVVSNSLIGIGVSVVDGAGPVYIGQNAIAADTHAVVGLAWSEIVEPDLLGNAARYSNVTVA